jgi:hypothetical protein
LKQVLLFQDFNKEFDEEIILEASVAVSRLQQGI